MILDISLANQAIAPFNAGEVSSVAALVGGSANVFRLDVRLTASMTSMGASGVGRTSSLA